MLAKNASEGRAVITITDAAANLSGVTSVKITVGSVEVHSSASGWVSASTTPKTYDLLALNATGTQALLADINLAPGTYQQIRLNVSSVVVTDASGDHDAKLPSGVLKIVGPLAIKANSTSVATFDFIGGDSLHVPGSGDYIFAPGVQFDTKDDADVTVETDANVQVRGGKSRAHMRVGMDAQGNVGIDIAISKGAKLVIVDGKVKIGA